MSSTKITTELRTLIEDRVELWTDYPIKELGDEAGKEAPIRSCRLLSYDGNKYATVEVGGVVTEFKLGYVYTSRLNAQNGDGFSHRHPSAP